MSTITLSYSESGFDPTNAPASPGDTITVVNTSENDITLTFTCGTVLDPLSGLTSPVDVPSREGQVSGDVRNVASNHTITFSANSFEATVDVGPASYQLTVTPESISPAGLEVNPLDFIAFYNASTTTSVELDIDSPTPDPFGPVIGMHPSIDPTGTKDGIVSVLAKNTKVKITVKGSSSATSEVTIGSGDTEVAPSGATGQYAS